MPVLWHPTCHCFNNHAIVYGWIGDSKHCGMMLLEVWHPVHHFHHQGMRTTEFKKCFSAVRHWHFFTPCWTWVTEWVGIPPCSCSLWTTGTCPRFGWPLVFWAWWGRVLCCCCWRFQLNRRLRVGLYFLQVFSNCAGVSSATTSRFLIICITRAAITMVILSWSWYCFLLGLWWVQFSADGQ